MLIFTCIIQNQRRNHIMRKKLLNSITVLGCLTLLSTSLFANSKPLHNSPISEYKSGSVCSGSVTSIETYVISSLLTKYEYSCRTDYYDGNGSLNIGKTSHLCYTIMDYKAGQDTITSNCPYPGAPVRLNK